MSVFTTSYEGQRKRVFLMERMLVLREGRPVSAARRIIARAVGLSPDQLLNIRKGKLKGLYDDAKRKIDEAFVAAAQGQIRFIERELDLAKASARSVDPSVAASATASLHALEELLAEARASGVLAPTGPETEH